MEENLDKKIFQCELTSDQIWCYLILGWGVGLFVAQCQKIKVAQNGLKHISVFNFWNPMKFLKFRKWPQASKQPTNY